MEQKRQKKRENDQGEFYNQKDHRYNFKKLYVGDPLTSAIFLISCKIGKSTKNAGIFYYPILELIWVFLYNK